MRAFIAEHHINEQRAQLNLPLLVVPSIGGVWVPGDDDTLKGVPTDPHAAPWEVLRGPKVIPLKVLITKLETTFFPTTLPRIVSQNIDQASWQLQVACSGCNHLHHCKNEARGSGQWNGHLEGINQGGMAWEAEKEPTVCSIPYLKRQELLRLQSLCRNHMVDRPKTNAFGVQVSAFANPGSMRLTDIEDLIKVPIVVPAEENDQEDDAGDEELNEESNGITKISEIDRQWVENIMCGLVPNSQQTAVQEVNDEYGYAEEEEDAEEQEEEAETK